MLVGIAQECLHTAKTKKLSTIILKLDLKKAYDKVSWQFLRLLLFQIGLNWRLHNGSWPVLHLLIWKSS
jgi:hypothetical protein